ncbi:DNA-3-methyladenine glycosylase I [Candidatus Dependentiae bacterium HGW-Dependentiae-1]|nr:MAG: DNA-3-methyladenine glycosylase I [Candidatus Dependentiae bacterium HGW-Dependentiae-1]
MPHLKKRCFGNGPDKKIYAAYHDNEWGIPTHNDTYLFQMLILEGAQAGLSWETVLKKREHYRAAFYNFDPIRIAIMHDTELEALLKNPGIIRNRLKIYSVRKNALFFLNIQREFGSFDHYLWRFVGNTPIINDWNTITDIPTSTPISEQLSRDLKKRGMTFVGPTIMYAYMQAVGMVNDHLASCWRHTP